MINGRINARSLTALLPLVLLQPNAGADQVTVTMAGSFVQSVTAGGLTIPASQLRSGLSVGEYDGSHPGAYAISAADGRNVEFYFARSSNDDRWDVLLGSWTDSNGSGHDFFVFEAGGNDSIQVAALFPGGAVGQPVSIGGWTSTGYQVDGGPNNNQTVFGLALRSTQLKRPDGSQVGNGDVLSGVRILSTSIDGAGFLAVDPSPTVGQDGDGSVTIMGSHRKWDPLELRFSGPWATETDSSPSPFLDRRLNVTFTGPSGQEYVVPGFFDGDGEGEGSGNVWTTRFAPDEVGSWTARTSFRAGGGVAVSLDPDAGTGIPLLNNRTYSFEVFPKAADQEGLWALGWLEYAGHYPKFREGPHWIKGGINSPENILGYRGFDEVADTGCIGILHEFEAHQDDWQVSDPNFRSNVAHHDGRGIVGAINYLSSQGVNSIFAMVMNLGGDGCDTHPFLGSSDTFFDKTHYDIGRLRQWNTVFEHAASRGIAMHFGLAETEPYNENWLDNGNLGVERKLFYRELVARFAHLPALKWTLCEENDYSTTKLREFADYIQALDVYGHAITFHNHPNELSQYQEVAGEERFSATSCQYDYNQAGNQVEFLRSVSAGAGRPWAVQMDENNPYQQGLSDTNADDLRRRVLYDVLFSGGHIEWYFGWYSGYPGGDLTVEDFRTREDMFRYMRYARERLEALPFWLMEPADDLLSGESSAFGGGEVFCLPGEVYAVYLPDASPSGTLDLGAASGTLRQQWYDPRTGQTAGSPTMVQGGGSHALGAPPYATGDDWVVILELDADFSASSATASVGASESVLFGLNAGAVHAGRDYFLVGSFGTSPGFTTDQGVHVPLNIDRYFRFLTTGPGFGHPALINTVGTLDASGKATARIRFLPGAYGSLVGVTLHHGFVLTNPADYASSTLPLTLLP